RRSAGTARRGRSRTSSRACRTSRGAAQPRAGGDLPRARAEVECELRRAQGGDRRRARARQRASTERVARRKLVRAPARTGEGLHLSARRSGGLRGRLPAGRAQGPYVLPPFGIRRGRDGVRLCTQPLMYVYTAVT